MLTNTFFIQVYSTLFIQIVLLSLLMCMVDLDGPPSEGLGIKSIMSSVGHPQTNGQAETTNKVILNELKKRLNTTKRCWTEELI